MVPAEAAEGVLLQRAHKRTHSESHNAKVAGQLAAETEAQRVLQTEAQLTTRSTEEWKSSSQWKTLVPLPERLPNT